jgi:hypothetical protein
MDLPLTKSEARMVPRLSRVRLFSFFFLFIRSPVESRERERVEESFKAMPESCGASSSPLSHSEKTRVSKYGAHMTTWWVRHRGATDRQESS